MNQQLVALDPHGMATAQHSLIDWCAQRIRLAKEEITRTHNITAALNDAKMSNAGARRLITAARKRLAFYEKVKLALEAGYYILPPIPHQAFAIRTDKVSPPANGYSSSWANNKGNDEVAARALPAGEGEYKNAVAVREAVDSWEKKESNGSTKEVTLWENTEWKDVEFPYLPVKPEIIQATAKALEKRIFDWLGVAPQYRSVDPMIIGCVKHYKQTSEPLHFFVAWWLDLETL